MEHTGFPSDETLASFLDGKLDPETRRRVMEHMTTCDECYATVIGGGGTTDTVLEIPGGHRSRILSIRWMSAIAAVMAIVVVGPVVMRQLDRPGLPTLAAAAPPQRRIEARLTEFPYQRMDVKRGGGSSGDDQTPLYLRPDYYRFDAAAARVKEEADKRQTPDALHALAVSQLVLGNYTGALTTFKSALRRQTGQADFFSAINKSTDAALLSDLSAAALQGAGAGDDAQLRLAALEAAQRAWRLHQTSEIAFNRALALEEMKDFPHAQTAWNDFLRLESDARWRDEAEIHLRNLRSKPSAGMWDQSKDHILRGEDITRNVARFPMQARMWTEDELLPDWARGVLLGDRNASAKLMTLERIGEALRNTHGERLLADAVAIARNANGPEALHRIAIAYKAYGDARELYRLYNPLRARRPFEASELLLREVRSPLALLAESYVAACDNYENDYTFAREKANAILILPETPRYHALTGLLRWTRARAELQLGRPYIALRDYQASLEIFDALGETDNVIAAHELLGECYDDVGNRAEAWRQRLAALDILATVGPTSLRYLTLHGSVARAAADLGAREAALLFTDEQLTAADTLHVDVRANALLTHSQLLEELGLTGRAALSREAARTMAEAVDDPGPRADALTRREFVAAAITAAPTTAERLRIVRDAVAQAAVARRPVRRAELKLLLSAEYERAGLLRASEATLGEAMEEFAADPPLEPRQRSAYMDVKRATYLAAARLASLHQDINSAFALGELARSPALSPQQPGLVALQASLAPDTATVAFTVCSDGVLISFVARSDVAMFRVTVEERRLQEDVRSLGTAITEQDALEAARIAGALGRLLVTRWSERARELGIRTIVVLSDPKLDGVPFAGLLDDRGIELVRSFRIIHADNAAAWTETVPRQAGAPNALLVSSEMAAGDQQVLNAVRPEVDAVGRLYSGARILSGRTATRRAFLQATQNASVIHYAGHAVGGLHPSPWAALIFALDDGDPGSRYLYASEIAATHFSANLVILAACSTAGSGDEPAGGMTSLAHAFLTAGVHVVVGTLWPVADHAASEFSIRFHEALQRGAPVEDALRTAQLAMRDSADPALRRLDAWGAFVVLRGSSREKERGGQGV